MEPRTGAGTGGPAVAGRRSQDGTGGEQARRWDQFAAIAGIVFIALVLASFFTPDTPSADSSTESIAAQLQADQSAHQVSLLLGFLADIAFLVFLAGLWSRLRRYEGAGGLFAGLFVVSGAVFVATILVSEGLYLALVQGADSTAADDPAVLRALVVLDNEVGAATIPAAVAMFLGATMAVLTTRALPAWVGWLAGAAGLLLVVSLGAVFDDSEEGVLGFAGFAGFLLFLIWVLATSIVLLLRAGKDAAPAPREPGAAARAA